MSNQEFTLVVDHRLTDEELDRLFEAGGDDTAPELQADRTVIRFDREADSLAAALLSGLDTVHRAACGSSASTPESSSPPDRKAEGWAGSDVATVLDVSPQRVSQLLKA